MRSAAIVNQLRDSLSDDRRMYFAGAGLSKASGIPVFRDLYLHILKCVLGKSAERGEPRVFLDNLRPEAIAETLAQLFGEKLFDFYRGFLLAKPNSNHQFLARALERGSCVFTTNLDTLIEDCCEQLGVGYELCVDDEDYESFWHRRFKFGSVNASGCLFKLRGSLSRSKEQPFRAIPLTIEDESDGLSTGRERVVQSCLRQYEMTVLGYSGMDHFSIQPLLIDIASEKSMVWYWYEARNTNYVQNREVFEQEMSLAREDTVDGVLDHPDELAKISMNEILLGRPYAVRVVGDTSRTLARALSSAGENPLIPHRRYIKLHSPTWAERVAKWQRNLLRGRLYRLVGMYTDATQACRQALKRARRDYDKGIILDELGTICRADSTSSTDDLAAKYFGLAARKFEDANAIDKSLIALIDQANIFRRKREFDRALTQLRKVRKRIALANCDNRAKRRIESFVLSTLALDRMRIRIASPDYDSQTRDLAGQAIDLAKQSGNLRRMSSCLNTAGLLHFQMARSVAELVEAAQLLERGYSINRKLMDHRGCYQQMRNLGLVQQKLFRHTKGAKGKREQLENALSSFRRAAEHVARILTGVRGESLEANFRIGETLVMLDRRREALPILHRVAEEQQMIGKWHNEGRALELVLKCLIQKKKIRDVARRVHLVYRDALDNPDKHRFLLGGGDQIILENAISIVSAAIEALKKDGSDSASALMNKLLQLRKDLRGEKN